MSGQKLSTNSHLWCLAIRTPKSRLASVLPPSVSQACYRLHAGILALLTPPTTLNSFSLWASPHLSFSFFYNPNSSALLPPFSLPSFLVDPFSFFPCPISWPIPSAGHVPSTTLFSLWTLPDAFSWTLPHPYNKRLPLNHAPNDHAISLCGTAAGAGHVRGRYLFSKSTFSLLFNLRTPFHVLPIFGVSLHTSVSLI